MSNPEGQKDLWKKVEWSNKEEKMAFYNKYFRNSDIVKEQIDISNELLKGSIINFIEYTKEITEGKIKRPVTKADIINKIKEL